MSTALWVLALVVVAGVAWTLSARRARSRSGEGAGDVVRSSVAAAELRAGDAERRAAHAERRPSVGDAMGRMHDYLRVHVVDVLRPGVGQSPPPVRERIERAIAAVEELEILLEERSLSFRGADVGRLLREVAEEFAAESPVAVDVSVPDRPVRARVAPEAFKDAVFLVLLNAEDFAPEGPVEVRLRQDSGEARIEVRDRGPGFAEEALRRAAEPFFSTREGALGLGLAHARDTIEAHGGQLRVGNAPGGGALVEIRLPGAG